MEVLNQILAHNAAALGSHPFIIFNGETITYAEFDARTARLAHVLTRKGVNRDDRVGLFLPSTPLMATAFWACQRVGAVPVPITAMARPAELTGIVDRSGMTALIADQTTWPVVVAAAPDLICLVDGSGPTALPALMMAESDNHSDCTPSLHDTAALFFSSGTTGQPKGIAQSHLNHASTLRDMTVAHHARFGREVFLCAVPLFTNFGLTVTLNLALYQGATLILHERWNTEAVLAAIKTHRVSYFPGTPTMFAYLVDGFDDSRHDLSSLRLCITGGSPVPQPVMERFAALGAPRPLQVYGATETTGQNVIEPFFGPRRAGAAGQPIGSSRITIIGDDGAPAPAGTIGEVVIGGDCVAQSYWNEPELTRAHFTDNGWLSGDLGFVDAEGWLTIVDRKKDVIITGGYNIYPLEIEEQLYRHAAVKLCAVIGVPDAQKGELPIGFVVAGEGAAVTAEALTSYLRQHLAAYKVPRHIHIVDHLPIEAAKIRKRELVAMARDGRIDELRRS